ncbi:MAG: hypothetical protein OIF40_06915 [Mangrovicoccus sp.]|nr:hypothetical protein [Mangrovicoccus sp.]
MALIADIFLISGAFGAAFYCLLLSRRLNRLSDLDGGVGKAIADLNAQVTDLSKTLMEARKAAATSEGKLAELTERAERVAQVLSEQMENAAPLHAEAPPPKAQSQQAPKDVKPAPKAEPDKDETASEMPAFVRGRSLREAAE